MAKYASHILELARHGAEARIKELEAEIASIRASFPGLPGTTRGRRSAQKSTAAATGAPRRKRTMSAAQRKAVSERMRKYWAARKKGAAKGKSAS